LLSMTASFSVSFVVHPLSPFGNHEAQNVPHKVASPNIGLCDPPAVYQRAQNCVALKFNLTNGVDGISVSFSPAALMQRIGIERWCSTSYHVDSIAHFCSFCRKGLRFILQQPNPRQR
jgi:hypothetical protein